MDDLLADISREYPTLASEQATPEEVQEFYKPGDLKKMKNWRSASNMTR
jgi:hypothetical protein